MLLVRPILKTNDQSIAFRVMQIVSCVTGVKLAETADCLWVNTVIVWVFDQIQYRVAVHRAAAAVVLHPWLRSDAEAESGLRLHCRALS